MGNVERVDKTLPTNEMVFYLRRDPVLQQRWLTDREQVCREFGLGADEIAALRDPDPRVLMDLGVHQYLVPHILRLTHGATKMTNTHPALTAYARAFPRETATVLQNTKWDPARKPDG